MHDEEKIMRTNNQPFLTHPSRPFGLPARRPANVALSLLALALLTVGCPGCGDGSGTTEESISKFSDVTVSIDFHVGSGGSTCSGNYVYKFWSKPPGDVPNPDCDPKDFETSQFFEDIIPSDGTCTYIKPITHICPFRYELEITNGSWTSKCELDLFRDLKTGGALAGRTADVQAQTLSDQCTVSYGN